MPLNAVWASAGDGRSCGTAERQCVIAAPQRVRYPVAADGLECFGGRLLGKGRQWMVRQADERGASKGNAVVDFVRSALPSMSQ